jgi:site-specific DNA recombinase
MNAQLTGPIDIYARVSRLGAKDQTTTTSQVTVCRAELVERGLPVGQVHIDDGKSAWNPKVIRKDWEAMMARLESGEAGGVIVYDLERFARQLADGERLVRAAERGLLVLDSEGSYDLRKPGDKKNFRNAIVSAEYYSDLLRAKTRRGKKAKAEAGEVDKRRSFGFEPDGVTIREEEAELIRDWAARLLAGETQQDIIAELNETGVASVRGAPWGYTTFRQIMLRPRNVGLIVHNGEVVPGVRLPGTQILEQLTHDRIVALYAARRPGRQPSGRYLLSGIAKCGPCGAGLSGRPVHGTDRKQYWCRECHHTFIDVAKLDLWAESWALRTLSDPAHADVIEAAERERGEKRGELLQKREYLRADMLKVAARLGDPGWDVDMVDVATKGLRKGIGEIDAELAAIAADEPLPEPEGRRPLFSPQQGRYIYWLAEWEEGKAGGVYGGTIPEQRTIFLRALGSRTMVINRAEGKGSMFVNDSDGIPTLSLDCRVSIE